jgi:hypothetical protein
MPLQRRGPGWRWWQFRNRQPYAYTRPFRAWLKTARTSVITTILFSSESYHSGRFGRFGFGWSFWTCFITLIRGEEDPVNSLFSGLLMNVHFRRRYYVRMGRRYNPFKYFNYRQVRRSRTLYLALSLCLSPGSLFSSLCGSVSLCDMCLCLCLYPSFHSPPFAPHVPLFF